MSIIAIATPSAGLAARYGQAIPGVRIVQFETTPKGTTTETELARADGPIASGPGPHPINGIHGRGTLPDGYNWFDEDAADALLASTGYQRPAGEYWRRSEIGLLLTIEPSHGFVRSAGDGH